MLSSLFYEWKKKSKPRTPSHKRHHVNFKRRILSLTPHLDFDFGFYRCYFWNIKLSFCKCQNLHKVISNFSFKKILLAIKVSQSSYLPIQTDLQTQLYLLLMLNMSSLYIHEPFSIYMQIPHKSSDAIPSPSSGSKKEIHCQGGGSIV